MRFSVRGVRRVPRRRAPAAEGGPRRRAEDASVAAAVTSPASRWSGDDDGGMVTRTIVAFPLRPFSFLVSLLALMMKKMGEAVTVVVEYSITSSVIYSSSSSQLNYE
jgi:hypothetical protein